MRSSGGRSAIARKVKFGGPSGTNGIMSQVSVKTLDGRMVKAGYFGGPKKGGTAPSATGYNRSFLTRSRISNGLAPPASHPNYLFEFKTNPGARPWGNAPHT
jgi:hypothetical protein